MVNLVGLLEQIAYIVIYMKYTENKVSPSSGSNLTIYYKLKFLHSQPRVQRDVTVAMVIVVPVVVYYTCIATGESSRLVQLGLICNFFTILFFASPLTTMVS